jgi:hypothetical protein
MPTISVIAVLAMQIAVADHCVSDGDPGQEHLRECGAYIQSLVGGFFLSSVLKAKKFQNGF